MNKYWVRFGNDWKKEVTPVQVGTSGGLDWFMYEIGNDECALVHLRTGLDVDRGSYGDLCTRNYDWTRIEQTASRYPDVTLFPEYRELPPIDLVKVREGLEALMAQLEADGEFFRSVLHGTDEQFTVFEWWKPLHTIYVTAAILAGRIDLYPSEHKTILIDGVEYPALYSLRIGVPSCAGGYGSPYELRYGMGEVEEIVDELVGEYGFSDEWDTCDQCGEIIRTAPDSYQWTPEFIQTEDGIFHVDCCDDEVLEELEGKPTPVQIASKYLEEVERDFQNGLHHGMDDDPKKISKFLHSNGIPHWYVLSPSQFYVEWRVWVQADDYDKAFDLLNNFDAYQGWSTAGEFSKALKSEQSTEHVKVTKSTLPGGGEYVKLGRSKGNE